MLTVKDIPCPRCGQLMKCEEICMIATYLVGHARFRLTHKCSDCSSEFITADSVPNGRYINYVED